MNEQAPSIDPKLRSRTRRDIVLYGLARIALFLVLTAVIQGVAALISVPVPLLMSALLALIVALPLSMFVFQGLRRRVTAGIAEWDAQRKAHKEWVKQELAER
ncbi:DUF4229 domain-containing protein [Corynebacterium canis]|uniref:DUF4229 domain-containing protein n=1 Tax=Corynebacterium canis TaxID=679663 RepID=A0A5C5UIE7_9CORY|nr:DUF4229 domain-containing protein [Corynebacterium canis]TWT25607.1 DUF4229 domain-containing protein [Corynebacterium canis]WJY74144.1 hypothetical protein CCANI_01410 [Corynebacterium canis]